MAVRDADESVQKTLRPSLLNTTVQRRSRSRWPSDCAVRDCCSLETFQRSSTYRNMRCSWQAFSFWLLSSSNRQDRRELADMLRIGVEQQLVLLHPGVRSPWLGTHTDHPGRKDRVARHESDQRQR